jgi:hypothetical protein
MITTKLVIKLNRVSFLKLKSLLDIAPGSRIEVTDVSQVYTVFITSLMMEAVRSSETSVYFSATTRHCIPEGSHFHARRRENVKIQHTLCYLFFNGANLTVPSVK